jgi:hypothetical protein
MQHKILKIPCQKSIGCAKLKMNYLLILELDGQLAYFVHLHYIRAIQLCLFIFPLDILVSVNRNRKSRTVCEKCVNSLDNDQLPALLIKAERRAQAFSRSGYAWAHTARMQ